MKSKNICFTVSLFAFISIFFLISGNLAAANLKVAAVLPGHIDDTGFNQAGYEGLKIIEKKLGAKIAYSEKVSQADQIEYLTGYARDGYDLIIGHGGDFDEAVLRVAKKFPKTKFFVTFGTAIAENVASGAASEKEPQYLAGVLSAKMSKSKKMAFISGTEVPLMVNMYNSFKKGIMDTDPSAQVSISWTGSWDDVAKAKEAALAQIAKGVDVIYPAMDLATLGSIEAARQKGIWAIGGPSDMLDIAPEAILVSVVQDFGGLLVRIAELVNEGEFEGKSYVFGIKDGVSDLGRYNKKVPQDVKDYIKKVRQQVIDKKISL
jgi:basic membrane protein A and related proteins